MLGNIKSLKTNYQVCYPSRLKKLFRQDMNYKSYDEFVLNTKHPVLGNLPKEILNFFGEEKGEKIVKFQDSLAFTASYIRKIHNELKNANICYNFNQLPKEKLEILEKSISDIFNSNVSAIMPEGYKCKFSYVQKGYYGNVFKFSLHDKNGEKVMHDKAVKVYISVNCPIENAKHKHNNFAEANFWEMLKYKNGGKLEDTQFTEHYMSDLKNAYTITDFIDEDISKTRRYISLKCLGIESTDKNATVKKKLCDAGGYVKNEGFIDDKVVYKYLKKLLNRNGKTELANYIARLQELVKNPKTPHRSKIQRALDLFQSQQ